MNAVIDGGNAFPQPISADANHVGHPVWRITSTGGMSLRDYFAAQMMPALLAEYFRANGACLGMEHARKNCAAHAYKYADAMLNERKAQS